MNFCESCFCLTLIKNDLNLCESCFILKTNLSYIPYQRNTISIEELEPIEIESIPSTSSSFSSQLFCTSCNSKQFLIPLSCLCQVIICCENCFKKSKCGKCNTDVNLLSWDIQVFFNQNNTFNCPWCKKENINVKDFLNYHLLSNDLCNQYDDFENDETDEKEALSSKINSITHIATQKWLQMTNENFDQMKHEISTTSGPLNKFYEYLMPKRPAAETSTSSTSKRQCPNRRFPVGRYLSNYT